ncbi:SusC/RagA family TonB-linked outer membrane protein [Sphingobacterium griseoflavum]|uniref:SusC/RagA family TonB-linked outer membrane protein n=1 Tax=Sphingobacterium griseoflavum TaxID=1474952 RepID=A0ABQ3I145_9SPHI|nr:SusC/RagA family TonB-linked outer membrane protein [Sphingobacterium griseoflavum]GHE45887.1 SusC/RagA family TonB-linked outer membrane protein [Sphingobacterium griseoflavum]
MNNILKQKRFEKTSACFQVVLYMKLTLILICAGMLSVSAGAFSQNKVSVNFKNVSLTTFLRGIEAKSAIRFVYSDEILEKPIRVTLQAENADVISVLEEALNGQGIAVSKVNESLYALRSESKSSPVQQEREVSGRVLDPEGKAIGKATIWLVGTKIGTSTNEGGYFRLAYNSDEVKEVEIRSVGFQPMKLPIGEGKLGDIKLVKEDNTLEEVVINTGMFERKAGTFTGSTVTFSQAQIKEVTNQNALAALAILDPSFQILENNELGSNPNALPDIQLRGQSGFSEDLRTSYSNAPNQPLFIIDGFESTIQRLFDLNINLISSITILKDAAAKAMWGAKAGNGVVVVETIKPLPGAVRIGYNASVNITAPDLSSYRLTNAMQKIEAEVLAGRYSSPYPTDQASLTEEYTQNLKAALAGVDTYWLSQPLQNGVGQRHTITADGGDDRVQYSVNLTYNNNKGVMKGSDRTTYAGQSVLLYRNGKISATNNLSIDRNFARNSPYGSFSDYARMNPYWRIYDENGALIPAYEISRDRFTNASSLLGNPLYNATLNTKDGSNYTTITENFQLDYRFSERFRLNARVGYNQQNLNNELFRSALHTDYLNISPSSASYLDRGIYRVSESFLKGVTSDVQAAYNKRFGLHQFYVNGVFTLNEQSQSTSGYTMVGFPNDKIDNISMGRRYEEGSKAVGTENTVRTAAITSALNYSYDNRYLLDASYRRNASSQFGRNSRWGNFWAVGAGWNVHQEQFAQHVTWIDLLRFTANTGVTGTPPGQNAYQSLATYRYNTDITYNGDMGLNLIALANPDLEWQKVLETNYRAEFGLFNRFNASFEYYIRDTKNLLLSLETAPSLGFDNYAENIGEVRNKGFQAMVNYRLIRNVEKRFNVSVFGNVAHNTNKISKISTSLEALNRLKDELYSETQSGSAAFEARQDITRRYQVGQSMNAIWAVRSLGIDPSNGKEIFLKQDGTITYEWSALDQVVSGDTQPLYNGTMGSNVQYKDFSVNFAFSYRWGGQMYNATVLRLVDNADFNYNVDIRALEDRWRNPGDQTLYKDIADRSATRPSTRFVQDWNEFVFSSVSLAYDFSRMPLVQRSKLRTAMFSVNMNDIGRLSSVKTERGLDYPYARTMSFTLSATF